MNKVLRRKRIIKLLGNMSESRLVYIQAPSGYGKTTTMLNFLSGMKQPDSIHIVSNQNEDEVMKQLRHIYKTDDFWMLITAITNQGILFIDNANYQENGILDKLLQNLASQKDKKHRIFVTTRQRPSNGLSKLILNQVITFLTPHSLLMREAEIEQLYKLNGISLLSFEIHEIYQLTRGWPKAVMILIEAYQHHASIRNDHDLESAVEFAFIQSMDMPIQIFMMKLSILEKFDEDQAFFVTREPLYKAFLLFMTENTCYIEQINEYYQIAPLLKRILQRRLYHSTIHYRHLMRRNAHWLRIHKRGLEAIKTYFEIQDYEQILQMIESENECDVEFMSNSKIAIMMDIPKSLKIKYPQAYLECLLHYICRIDAYQGKLYLDIFRNYIPSMQYKKAKIKGKICLLEVILNYQNLEVCGYKNLEAYQLLDGKISNVFKNSPSITYGSIELLFIYYKEIGGLFTQVSELCNRGEVYDNMTNGSSYSHADVLRAEYHMMIGNFKEASRLIKNVYQQSILKKNKSIYLCIQFCRGRLAYQVGDYHLFHATIHEVRLFREEIKESIYEKMAENILTYFYLLANMKEEIYPWIWEGETEIQNGIFINSLQSCLLHAKILLIQNKLDKLRGYCDVLKSIIAGRQNIIAEIHLRIFHVLSGPKEDMELTFNSLLKDCEKDQIIMVLLEYKEYLYPLLKTYTAKENSYINMLLYHMEQRKDASYFNKNHYHHLTVNEKMILENLLQGMNRAEIAQDIGLSINTIKYHLKQIYKKHNLHSQKEVILYYKKAILHEE